MIEARPASVRSPSLIRAIATVGGLTMVSRVAGFVRDILTAAILGAGAVADAFFVALKLPNLFRRLFAEGAFSVSFVPLFSADMESQGLEPAIAFAERALAVMIVVLMPLTVLAVVGMPAILSVIAPGFVGDPERFDLAVMLGRITFPYLILMSLVALMGGVLNALGRYGPFAAAPVLFNLCLIAALLASGPLIDAGIVPTVGHALAWGVLIAGVGQLLWLAEACRRSGVRLGLPRPRLDPRIRKLFRLMVPGALGAGVIQINIFIDILLASLLPTGAISYLYYADRLYQLPLGVIGIAIGTALLPMLARQVEAGDTETALKTQNRALDAALLLSIPSAVALVAIPLPILTVLFERGAFDADATRATALALAAYGIGIPAYVMVKVFSTVYFARQDTASPVKVAIVATLMNISLSLILIQFMGHVGLALATGLTAWLHVAILARGLGKRGLIQLDGETRRRIQGQIAAGAILGLTLVGATFFAGLGSWIPLGADARTADGLLAGPLGLAGLILLGVVAYFAAGAITGGVRPADIKRLIRRKAT